VRESAPARFRLYETERERECARARESEIGKSGTREGKVVVSTAKDGANALGDTAPHPIRNRVQSSRMLVRGLAIVPCHRQAPTGIVQLPTKVPQ